MSVAFHPFVYGLVDPLDPSHIRYVGMAPVKATRPYRHAFEARRINTPLSHKINWIRKLHAEGREYSIVILEELAKDTQREFIGFIEQCYIKSLRTIGHNLTNATDGGEGCLNPSAEVRARRSMRSKGNKYALGRVQPEEERLRRGESIRKFWANHPNRPTPDGVREKIAATLTGFKHTPEARANMAASRVGSKRSLESRTKMSAAQKGRVITQEQRDAISRTLTGRKDSEETKAKKKAAQARRRGIDPCQ